MPPKILEVPRDQLTRVLLKKHGAKSSELAALVQASTPTMVRMLNAVDGGVCRENQAELQRPMKLA